MLEIRKNISLRPFTTFAVEATADYFVELHDEQEIYDLISEPIFQTHPHLLLGGGANILFTKDYHGLVVKVSLMGKKIVKENDTLVHIKVGAGESRHDTLMRALSHGYVGGENMVLIPGNVGSAPVGNIGAYGKEAKDIIHEVEGIELETGAKKIWSNTECAFGYRDSIFKHALQGKVIITAVTFVFEKATPAYKPNIQYKDIQDRITAEGKDPATLSAQEVADSIISIRQGKLPDRTKIGTAGSFFKNPIISQEQYESLLSTFPDLKGNAVSDGIKLSAGQLIELAGYKGRSEGPVGTYEKHALILVNHGGATGEQVRSFAQAIQHAVQERFGVVIEPEVIII